MAVVYCIKEDMKNRYPLPVYDFHIHTYLNGHSDPAQDVPTILARADAIGLDAIAITEHIMEPSQIAWVRQVAADVSRASSSCRVIIGAEIDADPATGDGQLVFEPDDNIQLVLGSLHFFPGTRLMPHCGQIPDLPRAEIIRHWRKALLGLASNPKVDIIAHPGAMIANALPNEDFAPDVLETFAQAAQLSAQHGIAWELNRLIGAKLSPSQRQAYWQIPHIALDAGVNLVYGSDAHKPADIGSTVFVADIVAKLGGWDCLENPQRIRRRQRCN